MGMMDKALLQRASESVLHAEKRRLLWGANPNKPIGYGGSVSCSPVIPDRYRNPGLPDVRYLFVGACLPRRMPGVRWWEGGRSGGQRGTLLGMTELNVVRLSASPVDKRFIRCRPRRGVTDIHEFD